MGSTNKNKCEGVGNAKIFLPYTYDQKIVLELRCVYCIHYRAFFIKCEGKIDQNVIYVLKLPSFIKIKVNILDHFLTSADVI